MKNKFFTCLLILVIGCVLLFSSCIKEHVTGVTLNKTTLGLLSGESETLIATVYPDDATNRKVTWKSSNSQVATVTDNGLVTAVTDGNALITATTKDGKKTATCEVIVDYRAQWIGKYVGIKTTTQTIVDVTISGDSNLKIIERGASAYYPDAYHDVKVNEDGSFYVGSNIEGNAFPLFGNFYPDSLHMYTAISSQFIEYFLKKNKS